MDNMQFYMGLAGEIALNVDIYKNFHKYFEVVTTLGIPLRLKYFFPNETLKLFREIQSNFIGFRKQYLSVNVKNIELSFGNFGNNFHIYYNFSVSLAVRYWVS